MKISRRNLIKSSLSLAALPELIFPKTRTGYTSAESATRLRDGKALTKSDLVTPCLLLDLDAFEANVNKMAAHCKTANINLRPHGKSHKCPEIALRQRKAGALGLCVATIREAQVMAAAGVTGILITSELVGRPKIERLMQVVRKAPDTMAVVDNLAHAQELNDAAGAAKLKLHVLIDVDPGGKRTGIASGAPTIAFAEKLMKMPHLKLHGFHCYSGSSAHIAGFEARRQHSLNAMTPALETFAQLKQRGLPMEILSGGSTGTYNIDPAFKGMTELQCGSYVFMDVEYQMIGGQRDDKFYDDFAPSLTVMATVISRNHPDRATTDAGIKSFATDRKFGPNLKDLTGARVFISSDEHGTVLLDNPSREVKLGDRLEFIIPHCDPNV
ncbi:MAG TPA: DSD1 family PLP-dependent enzyme, partial [Blastocatellia bacterium]|nr:DSD1 family PLP-dependent enzyme [Blastocatellia bacterium]